MSWLGEWGRRFGMLLRRERLPTISKTRCSCTSTCAGSSRWRPVSRPTTPAAAAHRRFGNPTLLREHSYTAWGWSWLESLLQDILYGLRAMLRSPGITLVALLSLALGIGANTAIFSLMDAVMLRSLPVKDPQQLVLLGKGDASGITENSAPPSFTPIPSIASCSSGTRSSPRQPRSSACQATSTARSRSQPGRADACATGLRHIFPSARRAGHASAARSPTKTTAPGRSSGRRRQRLLVEERPGARSQCAQSHAENRRHDLQHHRRRSS